MRTWWLGFGLGAFVAMQLGPMSLLLIRSTLRGGWRVGLAIGAGIATVDGLYAAAGAAGAAPLLSIGWLRVGMSLTGAAVLIALGVRTLWSAMRVRHGGETPGEVESPRRAYLTALAGTASNPATILSWAAIFAAAGTVGSGVVAGHTPATGSAVLLVAGIAAGSLVWVTALASAVALARRAVGDRLLRAADALAGCGMLGFGGALGYGVLRER